MGKYDVELLPAAYTDLDEIFDYIMADNPQAAAEMLDTIMESLRLVLKIFHILEYLFLAMQCKSSISEWLLSILI